MNYIPSVTDFECYFVLTYCPGIMSDFVLTYCPGIMTDFVLTLVVVESCRNNVSQDGGESDDGYDDEDSLSDWNLRK
jgi:hypothetical protein